MSETFRFGNVSGPVNAGSGTMNVGSGSQTVAGRDVSIGNRVGADPEVAEAITTLRQVVADLRLSSSEREAARRHLDAIDQAEDKAQAAGHLESLVSGVQQAGALASAGATFAESVGRIAAWLGPVAAAVLHLL
jgi:hypothetical protein